jgi:alpha-D-xyloside xylohydrolase
MSSIRALGSAALTVFFALSIAAPAQQQVVMEHDGSTVTFEPYAQNIIRVSLSLQHDPAVAAPGYGFVAKPDDTGWTHTTDERGDTYRSSRLVVTLDASRHHAGKANATQSDIAKFFTGSTPGAHIRIATPEGAVLVDMVGWQQSAPNYKDGNADILYDKRPQDEAFFRVGATFVSPPDEHYYGLGQDQHGFLDHRGHTVYCQHDYDATGGPSFCVPFAVTNKGYGLVWDNPSKTRVEPGFNEQTKWISEVGNRVSFFVIAGRTTDEMYAGYRKLTGATPMLPKAAYGFIQCKQRYMTQDELLAVANGYRERHLPLDVLVVDWFYYTKMGQFDMDPVKWPDPVAMNKQLHADGIQTMISVWPRFTEGSRYYDFLLKKGWFEHLADGTPTNGLPYDKAG